MKNQLKLMVSKKVPDQSHFSSNIERLFYTPFTKDFYRVAGYRTRLGINKLHELRKVQFLKSFSAKFFKFSAKFGSLNMQIRHYFKNIIFIAFITLKVMQNMEILC